MAIYNYQGKPILSDADTTLSQVNVPADAKATGDLFDRISARIEPASDDIPELHFTGTLPTSKEDGKVLFRVEYYSKTQ